MVSTARSRLLSSRTSARVCNTQSDLPSAASRMATAGFPGRVLRTTANRAASISHTTPLSGISTNTPGRSGFASTAPGALSIPICLDSTNAFKSTTATVRAPALATNA